MPYMICDKCNTFYKLKEGEFPEQFDTCECGNKLKYYNYLVEYTKCLDSIDEGTKDKNLVDLWFKQSMGIKLASVLAIFLIGIFLIAGIYGIFSSSGFSDQNTVYGDQVNKTTVLLMYAGWWSGCHDFEEKTLSDGRVKEKIGKYYNFQKIDVDQNKDLALKYSDNGAMTLPTVIIVDSNGNEIKRHEGYMTPDEFLEFLKKT